MSTTSYSYVFGRFRLKMVDDRATELTAEGKVVGLSMNELTVLGALLAKPGEPVKPGELLDSVSKSPEASANLVHQAVSALRRTLNNNDLIITERLKGYYFAGEVIVVPDSELPPEPIPEPISDPTPEPISDPSSDPPSEPIIEPAPEPIPAPNPEPAPDLDPVPVSEPSPTATPNKQRDPFVAIAILVSAPIFILPFALAVAGVRLDSIGKQIGIIQALVILVGLGFDFSFSDDRVSPGEDHETKRARIAVQQLRRSWRLLLACWCALYIAVPFSHLLAQASSGRELVLPTLTTLLNNASALMLVLCYWVLKRPAVISVAGRDLNNIPLQAGLLVVGGFSLIEAVGIVGFEYLRADAVKNVIFGADLLSGVVGGIAMALCISRLDSRLLGTKGWLPIVPIVLYLYAVIQPFYPLINQTFPAPAPPSDGGKFALTQLAFIQLAFLLKSVMFIYVTELFRSERLHDPRPALLRKRRGGMERVQIRSTRPTVARNIRDSLLFVLAFIRVIRG